MPLVLPGVDEPTFNKLTQRFHRALLARHPQVKALVSLGQLRESLIESMGYRSVHAARQAWRKAPPSALAPSWRLPEGETYDRRAEQPVILSNDCRGCNYQGYEFGAHYPDSVCIEGWLWDADSGEAGLLSSGGDLPCPWCNHQEWVERALDAIEEQGWNAHDKGEPRTANPFPQKVIFHHLGIACQAAWEKGWASWAEDGGNVPAERQNL